MKREIRKYFELKENEDTMYENLGDNICNGLNCVPPKIHMLKA